MSVTNPSGQKSSSKTTKRENSVTTKKISGAPIIGTIPKIIGIGDDAKNSFIWISIIASFCIGSVLSAGLYARSLICELGFNFVDDLKSLWSIFIPIVTLALGYAFGKGQK